MVVRVMKSEDVEQWRDGRERGGKRVGAAQFYKYRLPGIGIESWSELDVLQKPYSGELWVSRKKKRQDGTRLLHRRV